MLDEVELEALYYVDDSGIHGKGLYARVAIKKGTYMGTYDGPEGVEDGSNALQNGSHVLWVEEEDGTWTGRDGQNILRYLNHGAEPHAEFNGFDLYAVKNIRAGEELTIDYGEEPNPDLC
ncbi:MAG: SET domain-containing protein [Gammaproteobacteria bacterium]|nr:SET domain-containing protein [Gammaproteobacteria bacterium]MCW8923082.1 SET domain-containing protein [Gammaproteobacteria bacterium]